jgi:hypothetical protein
MKSTLHFLTVVAILCVVGCTHTPPVANPVNLSPAIASVDKADTFLTKAIKSNDKKEIVQQVQSARQDLQEAKTNLLSQQKLSEQVAATRDWWMQHSADQDKEITVLKEKLVHFHHLVWIASSLSGVLAGLVIGRFAMAFSPYGALVGIAVGVMAGGATAAILSHL